LKKAGKEQNPAKAKNVAVIAKSRRQTSKSVANLVARATKYRPDLRAVSIKKRWIEGIYN
jgi:large subunit ribosomal protein L28e